MRAPIVLLTDFGHQDPYVGVMKGILFQRAASAEVIDLSHGVEPQNIAQASVFLESSFRYFPSGSVFVCVVDPGVGTSRRLICARTRNYYFIAPDNGLLADVLAQEKVLDIRIIMNAHFFLAKTPSTTFHGRDILAPVAASLYSSKNPAQFIRRLGPKQVGFVRSPVAAPVIFKKTIGGEVLFFDHFGNAVSNIRRSLARVSFWRKAQVEAGTRIVGGIHETYGSCPPRRLCAIFNSDERLELAVPNGRADQFLKKGDLIKVRYET